MAYFPEVSQVAYEGPDSTNPLAFRQYNPDEVIEGKTMREHLRFAVCYWHTFRGTGSDPFGPGCALRPWEDGTDSLEMALKRVDVAFEFMAKLGVPFYCFHDRDVAPEGANLAKYGLTKPTGSIVVAAGSTRATLTLGSTDNSLLFARDGSRPMVFTVAPVLKDDVIRSVGDFRRKDLFDARAFTATRVELTRGADTVTLEKSKGKDGADVWQSSGKDVESGKADDLLTKLTALRAQSYDAQAHSSLKTPALVVTISFDEKKQEKVTFGRSQKDVYASRSDEPGAAKLEASGLDEVMKALEALK